MATSYAYNLMILYLPIEISETAVYKYVRRHGRPVARNL